ncbi:hypothetical protein GQ600_21562 [Phytophthora cactorum]|nr:hypothetical protein GQ600_21562 [Phytophthora cactorum]
MRSGPLWALRSANVTINAHISRYAWVGWLFIYLVELIFFSTYRLSNLSDLVKTSKTPNDDTTPTRIYGVLLGIVQDFVVISFLIVVLSVFDAAINHSCCNDTAPNGCTDCFTPGIPFWLVVFGLGLAAISFVMTPLLVLLITSYCPPAVASIALNSNLNEPIRTITTLSFVPN